MRLRIKLWTALVAALALQAVPAGAFPQIPTVTKAAGTYLGPTSVPEPSGPGTPGIEQVGDIAHVASLSYPGGSDIEFASREVMKLSNGATGTPVCVADAAQPDGCARDASGKVIYQTEVRDFAVAGRLSQNAWIVDITDPRNPVKVGEVPCAINQNDIQIQGNILLVAADGSGSCRRPDNTVASFSGTAVLDFSNPRSPKYLSRLQYTRGSHNHTFHPTQPFVYLSDSDLASVGLGNVPVWDLSNPAAPVLRTEFKFGAHSPHDITFSADGTRAYAAAVSTTYIINTESPAAPSLISVIPNEGISISHQADPTPDGKYLLVSDEVGGGSASTASPGGPVYVYDIRNEARPVRVGAIGNDALGLNGVSTSHVFRINPDGYTMAIAWYQDGVWVIDYSDIRGVNVGGSGAATGVMPRVIGAMKMPNANTWAAKMWIERHPGYVFANDIARGLDIFYVSSMGPGYLAYGTIRGGHPATYSAGVNATMTEFRTTCDYTPASQGVDGWVQALPASVADGTHTLTAKAVREVTGEYDLDLYFFDKDCAPTGADEDAGTDETGDIPAGSAYVLVAAYAGENVKVLMTTGLQQPEA